MKTNASLRTASRHTRRALAALFVMETSLLTFPVFAADAPAPEAANLIRNPSWEETTTDASGKAAPVAWIGKVRVSKQDADNPPKATFSLATDGVLDGANAARIEGVAGQRHSNSLAEWTQEIRVKPNTRYYCSVNIRGRITAGWIAPFLEERIKDHAYPSYNGGHKIETADKSSEYTTEWQRATATFTTGPETLYLNISLRFHAVGDGLVEFDKILLMEIPGE
jgi:hypothetical protein